MVQRKAPSGGSPRMKPAGRMPLITTTVKTPAHLPPDCRYALRDGASWGVESVHEAVRWLQAQPDVDSDRIIVAGFCYGGGAAVRYAAAYPGEVSAARDGRSATPALWYPYLELSLRDCVR